MWQDYQVTTADEDAQSAPFIQLVDGPTRVPPPLNQLAPRRILHPPADPQPDILTPVAVHYEERSELLYATVMIYHEQIELTVEVQF